MSDTLTAPSSAPPDASSSRPSRVADALWLVVPYVVSVVLAFVVGGLVIAAIGRDPFAAFESVLTTSFNTRFGTIETLHKWVPVLLCAYAFALDRA